MKKTSQKKEVKAKMRELTGAELDQVSGGQGNSPPFGGPQGGGSGNSGPGDKHSPVEGPPPGRDPNP